MKILGEKEQNFPPACTTHMYLLANMLVLSFQISSLSASIFFIGMSVKVRYAVT